MADSRQSENPPLVLKGELGIQQAEEMHQSLLRALEQAQWLEVDLSQAREVGLCCLQLLCSAHRSAHEQGKRLTIKPGASPDFWNAVSRAGYLGQRGCNGQEDTGCLWNTEEES